MCFGFRPIVMRDCVGDRALGPHEANLFDLGQKYADVVDSESAVKSIELARAQEGGRVAAR
jgi:maleamate amidohydrolase